MLIFKQGNLLDSKCYALVNTVNIVGVMGKALPYNSKTSSPIITKFIATLVKTINYRLDVYLQLMTTLYS